MPVQSASPTFFNRVILSSRVYAPLDLEFADALADAAIWLIGGLARRAG